ncbi:gamma-aminobutyric acid type B receptor subunit 1-like isoform X2 [Anneissia japonica]|uniref:gamma-aminobutyric acid type B receptor subunit 1-like isoform X2 n=1 Tax=Anneissia japonica TaxID=1529436 RepID=UPI0014256DBB|nr:gamma-aminobutyric acid type B receptor subunit 1-like isoform X2 [Anneissia japonica]
MWIKSIQYTFVMVTILLRISDSVGQTLTSEMYTFSTILNIIEEDSTQFTTYRPAYDKTSEGAATATAQYEDNNDGDVIDLNLMGFFPVTGESFSRGKSYYIAADMALRDVNARTDVLGGYRLQLNWRNTQCNAGIGTKSLFTFINSSTTYIMVLGTGCSVVAEPVSMAADLWNLLQSINRFGSLLSEANITLITSESFAIDPAEQIRNLKETEAWIIFGNFYENMARRVFCEVYKEGLYGRNYAWFLLGWYKPRWWEEPDDSISCTPEQLFKAVEGYFSTEDLPLSVHPEDVTVSGLTPNEYQASYLNYSAREGSDDINNLASYAYDAVWSIALALNKSIQLLEKDANNTTPQKLSEFTYGNAKMRNVFMKAMETIEFKGISGPVSFTKTGDREGLIGLRQMQGGEDVSIGRYEPQTDTLTLDGYAPIIWQGGSPPKDSILNKYSSKHISSTYFYIFTILSSFGVVLVTICAMFLIWYWKRDLIQKCTPVFHLVFLVGCTLLYLAIIMFSLDGGRIAIDSLATWCTIRAWVLAVGFSCAYGVLFSKIYRAHSVYTSKLNPWMPGSHCGHMIKTVLFCLVFDVIVLVVWMVRFPMEVVIEETDSILDTYTNIRTISQVEFCTKGTSSYFVAVFYVFNGLLLLLGSFLSYETRDLKILNLNDTFLNGIAIYVILTLSIVCASLSYILEQEPELAYVIIASLTWLATTMSVLLMFVPKVISLRGTFDIRNLFETKSDEQVFEEEADTETKLRYRIADVDRTIEKLKKQIARNVKFGTYASMPGACSVWCCGHHVGCTLVAGGGRRADISADTHVLKNARAGHDNNAYVPDDDIVIRSEEQTVDETGKVIGRVRVEEAIFTSSIVGETTTTNFTCETFENGVNEHDDTTHL